MKSNPVNMLRSFLWALLFLIGMEVSSQNMRACDFYFIIAAVLAVLIVIVFILIILVSFSLKENVSERYKLSSENKIRFEDKNEEVM
jgi:Na+/melibiose symporter-like transporter